MNRIQKTLLGEIAEGGDGYGLSLRARLRDKCKFWISSIYFRLRELERQGFLRSYEVPDTEGERGGKPRIYYSVTDDGRAALAAAIEEERLGVLAAKAKAAADKEAAKAEMQATNRRRFLW